MVLNKKKYYFYTIRWEDITGDAGHSSADEFLQFKPAIMVTNAYLFHKNSKYIWTFSSYDEKDEVFSDRNVFPRSVILKMEKVPQ